MFEGMSTRKNSTQRVFIVNFALRAGVAECQDNRFGPRRQKKKSGNESGLQATNSIGKGYGTLVDQLSVEI
jgi:hypothetical protein